MRNILIVALIIVVSGCATSSVNIPASWEYSGLDAVTVVAAIGISTTGEFKSLLPNHLFYIESQKSSEWLLLKAQNDPGFRSSVGDYETRYGKYGLVKLKLRPGTYKIINISSYLVSPYVNFDIKAEENFSIPFTLKPNTAYYLGTFTAYNITEDGKSGLFTNIAGTFWVADTKSKPNRIEIEGKFPELSGVTLINYEGRLEYSPYFFTTLSEARQRFKNTDLPIPPPDR